MCSSYLTILIPVMEKNGDPKSSLVELLKERSELTRVLAYCNSRNEGKRFCNLLNEGGVTSIYFDGETDLETRHRYIADLEEDRVRVLVTVRVLAEGIDIPAATTAMFVEPRNGHVQLTQCIGRVERIHREKRMAFIVLPSVNEELELVRFLNFKYLYKRQRNDKLSFEKRNSRIAKKKIFCVLMRK